MKANEIQSPYDAAQQIYQTEPCANSFEFDLAWHFRCGYVFSCPQLFLMGRAVWTPTGDIGVPTIVDGHADPNCWHIHLAVGDIWEFFRYEPYPLPYISFERKNVLRVFRRERLRRLCLLRMPSFS